jgi:DNA-binding CsgD family transcriptional regulator/PAS domain-containing protein
MPVDDEKLNRLVQQIYDAALDDALWPALIHEIAQLIKASDSLLYSPRLNDHCSPFTLSPLEHVGQEVWSDYASYYWQHDVWNREIAKQNLDATGIITHGDQLIERTAFRKTEFFNDLLMPKLGGAGVVLGTVVYDGSCPDHSPPLYLSFYNTSFAEAFTRQDENLIRYLLPHLQRALRVRWKIAREQQVAQLHEAVLERLESAVLVLDKTGLILFANQKAEQMLSQGGHPSVWNGRLCSRDVDLNNAINQALSQAQVGYGSTLRFNPSAATGSRVLTFSPISAKGREKLAMPIGIMVIMTEPEKPATRDLSVFAQLYQLSSAETRVLTQLLQQDSTKAIADALHINMATVRSHLRALFTKTHTKSQRELIKFCLAHPNLE